MLQREDAVVVYHFTFGVFVRAAEKEYMKYFKMCVYMSFLSCVMKRVLYASPIQAHRHLVAKKVTRKLFLWGVGGGGVTALIILCDDVFF